VAIVVVPQLAPLCDAYDLNKGGTPSSPQAIPPLLNAIRLLLRPLWVDSKVNVPDQCGRGAVFRYPRFMEFRVTEMNGEIIVTNDDFRTVYYKPDKLDPRLALRRRTETEDHALLARAWRAANDKARELGWIL
jgi:hypothetical protein